MDFLNLFLVVSFHDYFTIINFKLQKKTTAHYIRQWFLNKQELIIGVQSAIAIRLQVRDTIELRLYIVGICCLSN